MSSPSHPTRKRGEKRNARDQLLEATSALMIEKNTIDLSLGEIAQRAGLNAALVSYYFGGKEGLLMALVKRDTAQGLREMQSLVNADLAPEEKLKKHLIGMINFNFRRPYITRLVHALMRDPNSENAREITETFTRPITEAEANILNAGMVAGCFREIDPVLFYVSAVGACDRLFWGSSSLFGLDKIDVDNNMRRRFIDHTIQLLLQGCLAKQG